LQQPPTAPAAKTQQRTIEDMRYIGELEVKVRQLQQRCERLEAECDNWSKNYLKLQAHNDKLQRLKEGLREYIRDIAGENSKLGRTLEAIIAAAEKEKP
jgi:flagellar biosynthesis chaperone FliJ